MKQFTSSRGKDKVKDNNKKYGKYNFYFAIKWERSVFVSHNNIGGTRT